MKQLRKEQASVSDSYWKRNSHRESKYKIQGVGIYDSISKLPCLFFPAIYLLLIILCFNSCSPKNQNPPIDPKPSHHSIGINHIQTIKGSFSQPAGISVDADGKIYLVDSGKSRIFVINKEWEIADSIGRFGWKKGEFDRPTDVAIDNRLRLYIADSGNNRVQRFSLIEQTFGVIVGDKPDDNYAERNLYEPRGVSVDSKGDIYIVDTWNHRILKIDPLGRFLLSIGGAGMLNAPQGVAIDKMNNIYVCDNGNHRICKLILAEQE